MSDTSTAAEEIPEIASGAPVALLSDERDAGAGLRERTIEYLSDCKGEPSWIRAQRLEALRAFQAVERTPVWAPTALAELPWDALHYYRAPAKAAGVARAAPTPPAPRSTPSA